MNNTINKKAGEHVTVLFEKMHNPNLVYHNLEHTKYVVQRTNEIATHYNLNEKELTISSLAAWFHDTGHLFTDASKHEEQSVEIMKKFMTENDNDPQLIAEIEGCILATKFPRHPQNLLQEIICDADTYHLGTKEFKEVNKKVFEEHLLRVGPESKEEWNKETLELLESHKYYTSYCRSLLEEKKQSNMKKLKKKIMEPEKEASSAPDDLVIKKTNNLTTKGIQTMLRLTSENHLKLSDMADRKANILISVNSIIISVILGVLLRKLPEEPNLTIPSVIFLLVLPNTKKVSTIVKIIPIETLDCKK